MSKEKNIINKIKYETDIEKLIFSMCYKININKFKRLWG